MTCRYRWFTTAGLACQLIFPVLLLTFGLRAQAQTNAASPVESSTPPVFYSKNPGEVATVKAVLQKKEGDIWTLKGDAEVEYKDMVLRADNATYNDSTGEVVATGHVSLDGGRYSEHIEGTRAEYNVRTETGKLYDAAGTTGIRMQGKTITLITSNPFAFTGKIIEKVGPERYIVHHGMITSCELPKPKWTFSAPHIEVKVGETAKVYNGVFKVKKVPVFYFPFARHAVEKLPRESGFLTPIWGTSNIKGIIFGDAFYWAINRSMDATIGAQYWSAVGWAQHARFRATPTDRSRIDAYFSGVVDRKQQQASGQDIHLFAGTTFSHDVRAVASLEYLSNFALRVRFAETYFQAINSEVNSVTFLTKNYDGYSFNLMGSRYQNFLSTTKGDVVTIFHAPGFDSSSVDRSIGDSRFFWSYDFSVGGVSRADPIVGSGDLTGRADLHPRISYSLVDKGWTFRPEIAVRDTFYTEQQHAIGGVPTPSQDAVNRHDVEGSVEVRPPALARIYEKPVLGHSLKHTIEPRAIYRYTTGINNFAEIIRFDDRDIVTDTNEAEVGVINRLYAKQLRARCSDEQIPLSEIAPTKQPLKNCANENAREIASWEIGQKYYFDRNFGSALVPGRTNVFANTIDLTGIAFLTEPRNLSPIVSRLRVFPNLASALEWHLSYDTKKGRISSSFTSFYYYFSNFFAAAGHSFLQSPEQLLATRAFTSASKPPSRFNQYSLWGGYGNPRKTGFTAAASMGFNVESQSFQSLSVEGTYNWDCCGITMEYRRLALGPLRNENQYRFVFSLANVGSFGNLRRQERVY